MKPPLQIPLVFGHWLVKGNRLLCRLPRKAVTVRAPNALLTQVMHLCDGSHAWPEVMAALRERWAAETVAAFMLQLARERLLVEASELWAHWSEVAQLPSATAIQDSPAQIARLHTLAESRLLAGEGVWQQDLPGGGSALAALLAQRESSRTFADQAVSAETLCSILWAAHGVARPSGAEGFQWHRTVASGGNMHSARWFVAVLRELPASGPDARAVQPGVYEARFHVAGGASLRRLHARSDGAWHCLRDPRVLRFASALLLPAYDVAVPGRKYGNRATLFATIEAGQSLQNAQLMATALGAAGMLRGDTIASEALALAGLHAAGPSRWLAMPGMVLGARPSALERSQQASENWLKVSPNLKPRGAADPQGAASFAFAAVAIDGGPNGLVAASGRGADPRLAMTKAEAEAWERLGWTTPSGLVEARWSDLKDAIAPQALVAYSARQYAQPGFSCSPFSPRRLVMWKEAVDVQSGRAHPVLAECVYARAALPARIRAHAYTNASTSGVAAGTSFDDALCRATLELVERDAFACAWLAGPAPAAIAHASLPRAAARKVRDLEAAGMRIAVLDIGTTWAPVVAVFAQCDEPPFTAITAAAALEPQQALLKALEEAEGRIAHAQTFPRPPADAADPMRRIERHYRGARSYRGSDFFAQAARTVPFGEVGRGLPRSWAELKDRIAGDGFQLLGADITPPQAAIHQGRVPLRLARAWVPGLVPLWFEAGMQPEGMPRFIRSADGARGRPAGFFVHPFT